MIKTAPINTNRVSYMSARVLLNLLNEVWEREKMRGLPSILSIFRNGFDKYNNTGVRMLESIYHMTYECTEALEGHFYLLLITYYLLLITYHLLLITYYL